MSFKTLITDIPDVEYVPGTSTPFLTGEKMNGFSFTGNAFVVSWLASSPHSTVAQLEKLSDFLLERIMALTEGNYDEKSGELDGLSISKISRDFHVCVARLSTVPEADQEKFSWFGKKIVSLEVSSAHRIIFEVFRDDGTSEYYAVEHCSDSDEYWSFESIGDEYKSYLAGCIASEFPQIVAKSELLNHCVDHDLFEKITETMVLLDEPLTNILGFLEAAEKKVGNRDLFETLKFTLQATT